MKFLAPFCLAALLITNVFLALENGLFYKIMLSLQAVFYGCGLIGFLKSAEGKQVKWIGPCHVFLTVNAAYTAGWFKYLTGETYTVWKSPR